MPAPSWIAPLVLLCATSGLVSAESAEPSEEPSLTFAVETPIDHDDPAAGTFPLHVELGAPFDRSLPTVVVVADGQQFYVREGAMPGLQEKLFGETLNVVGVLGRGRSPEVLERVRDADGAVDWAAAYRLLRSRQWVGDLQTVRKQLLDDAPVRLYGRSGGALLVHEYLARYGDHVDRAFTQAAVATEIEAELAVRSDRFWDELDEDSRKKILASLPPEGLERTRIILALQRQNFFVPPDELSRARAELLATVHAGNKAALDEACEEYQVDAVLQLMETDAGIAIAVRQYEFYMPLRPFHESATDQLHPSIEAVRIMARRLIEMHDAGKVPAPAPTLGRSDTRVFLLAGRRDHTVDWRSQIVLAARYPNGTLFLADDDHVFHRLAETGLDTALVRAVLAPEAPGPSLAEVLARLESLRWSEWR